MKQKATKSFLLWYQELRFFILPIHHPYWWLLPRFSLVLFSLYLSFLVASTKIHPATLVTNIKNCVPLQLDEEGVNYNTWSTLFQLHCRVHLVIDHIIPDDSSKASEPRERLNHVVRTWIYGTICPALLTSIFHPKDRALDAWNRIENKFLNKKASRILHLESQFNELSLAQFSNVKSYCNELKNIATTLDNLGTSIPDNRLALKVLHGLTSEYRTFLSLIQHMDPVLSFDSLWSMLELEEHSNKQDNVSSSHESALVTNPRHSNLENSANSKPRGTPYSGGYRNPRRGGRNSRGNHHSPSSQQFAHCPRGPNHFPSNRPSHYSGTSWQYPPWPLWPSSPWAQPNCPHRTTPWIPQRPHVPKSSSTAGLLGPHPAQNYCTSSNSSMGYLPTDIDQALHTLSLSYPDEHI